MKSFIVAIAILLTLAPPAHAGERVGDAALGALSGAVVLGPVGLVAGAVVGFTAGPAIAQSWRANRNLPRQRAHAVKRPAHVAARQTKPRTSAPAPGEVTPAPGAGGPPALGLE